ncbi:MAG TPA: flagellar biosynthesis anti-sigma factor FlgM [Spirochaetia bacterium]|nr:flagellar biosynthesis anti-sigma factor FlgM [Spirochaetales bacterium]HRS66608.1 flagellar biosynthesis anti-sigma factor FlgM [Spirochaetia bacterium]HOT59859.1 flagellar biosynthesis anti-sigma factor FlgM [Spirochaetales bacterium]HPD81030.1 flagellar biosynthesis anti-sigma factor FlgM [Spirochaetales bacterium]HQG40937.1 flagellar biosynthesis anti-sigma factor FlgM [Spirochaetales bacterium]
MIIDRLNSAEPIQPKKNNTITTHKVQKSEGDSVSLSADALEKAELYAALEIARSAPDERLALIEELKAKINDPAYINEEVLGKTADGILDQLL